MVQGTRFSDKATYSFPVSFVELFVCDSGDQVSVGRDNMVRPSPAYSKLLDFIMPECRMSLQYLKRRKVVDHVAD